MPTIQQQILDDVDSVFDAGLTLDVVHVNGATNETIKAFFDNPYSTGLVGDGDIENPTPAIIIKTSDSSNIDKDSHFTILGTVYYPIDIEPDEHGVRRVTISEDQNK